MQAPHKVNRYRHQRLQLLPTNKSPLPFDRIGSHRILYRAEEMKTLLLFSPAA